MAFPANFKKGKGKKKGKLADKAKGKNLPPWLQKKKGMSKDCPK